MLNYCLIRPTAHVPVQLSFIVSARVLSTGSGSRHLHRVRFSGAGGVVEQHDGDPANGTRPALLLDVEPIW